ncbi:MAG: hypothetical protein Q9220_002273 [cf. Caloplaca sp. 1 TL-2023]
MEIEPKPPTSVLLVGSIPLSTSSEVFTKVSSALPNRLYSLPDGEPGNRNNYIGWQLPCFPIETRNFFLGGTPLKNPQNHPAYTLQDILPTKYDDAALSSYNTFTSLRTAGKIPADLKFQVCLPTPFNAVQGHTRPEFHAQLEPLYETRIKESVSRICSSIPHSELVIQWDICFELIALEYERGHLAVDERYKAHHIPAPVQKGAVERVVNVCEAVPRSVEVAFHLCYGDLKHKHFVEPESTATMVDLANAIITAISPSHTIKWIHMPVPKDRKDTEYFTPLQDLKLSKETQLYLGLIHAHDEAGTRERITTAQRVYGGPFGVATECGMGRTPVEELDSIFEISRAVTTPAKGAGSAVL